MAGYEQHDAPTSVESFWLMVGGTLHIWVDSNLDKVAQQRYISEACRLNDVDRHRRLLPVLFPGLGTARRAAHQHALATGVTTAVVIAGVAAAAVLPAVSGGGNRPRPPSAGRAPAKRAPSPGPPTTPASPKPDPTSPQPARPAGPPLVPVDLRPSAPAVRHPGRVAPHHRTWPPGPDDPRIPPVPPPPGIPTPPVAPSPPAPACLVRLDVHLVMASGVRLLCRRP